MKYFLMTNSKTGKIVSLEAQKVLFSCYDVKKINEEVVIIDNKPVMIHNYTEI